MPPALRPRWPQRSLRQLLERHHSAGPADRLRAASPTCRHARTVPKTARPLQPSPCGISSAAAPADRWAPLSSHPCLTAWSEEAQTAGSLCSTDIAPRHHYYGPFRRPLLFARLPGLAGYTDFPAPPFSRREEEGFSSCSARPCHRAAATTPSKSSVAICQLATLDAVFTLGRRIRPSRFPLFGATRAFAYTAAR